MLRLEDLAELASRHADALPSRVAAFDLGGRRFDGNVRSELMGVINLSADSWYRESVVLTAEAAIRRGRVLAAQGAAILDIGAESTLAHAARVDDAAQTSQLLPVVRGLASGARPATKSSSTAARGRFSVTLAPRTISGAAPEK